MQKINLNIVPNGIYPRVYVNQYDVGRGIQVFFKEGTSDYNYPSGTTFKVNGRKSDGHVFEYTESDKWDDTHYIINKSMPPGGIFSVYLYTTEQMTAAPGEVEVQLTYEVNNAIVGTLNFIMYVQEQPYANGDPSGSDFPEIIAMATEQMLNAEAWAVGEKDGVPVASTEPQYHNNSSYYAQRARTSASSAANSNTMAAVSASAAEGAATKAEAVAAHPPRLDPPGVTPNGNWWIWDNTLNPPAYRDSGVNAGVSCDVDPNTVTLPAGSSAAVQNTGTQTDPRFKFSIPKGDKGDKGDTGPIGPTGDSQDVLEAVGWTGANLFNGGSGRTVGGITVTKQTDGKYLVTGTAQSSGTVTLIIGQFTAKAGVTYHLSGFPSGYTGTSSFHLGLYAPSAPYTLYADDRGNGATFTRNSDTLMNMVVAIPQSFVCPSNFIWSPMISRNGGEYVPYHRTVQQELWDGEVSEPKNVLPIKIISSNASLSYTISDAGINIAKSSTISDYASLIIKVPAELSGNYYVSGCPSGGSNSTFDFYMWDFTANARCKQWDGSTPVPFIISPGDYKVQIPSGHSVAYIIRLAANYTTPVGGITFKPMISVNGGAYSPYYVPLKDVVPTKCDNTNIAPTEDGATASQSIAVNDLFIRGGALCICDQPISSGGSFTEGTNYHKTTLAAIIAALRA